MQPHPGRQRPLMGVEPLEGRQQGGVDIHQPVAPALAETLGQHPHEAGQRDQLHAMAGQHRFHRGLETRTVSAVVALVHHRHRDAARGGMGEPRRIRAAGQHQHDLGGVSRVGGSGKQSGHVAPAPRDQDRGRDAAHQPGQDGPR